MVRYMHRAVLASVCVLINVCVAYPLQAEEGNYLYKVTTVRAAPGSLSNLLDWIATQRESTPFVMRHSQGDQWDLMVITPLEKWSKNQTNASTQAASLTSGNSMIAFEEDHFAYGPSLSLITAAYDDNGFFHIEMFNAAPGKADKLLEQRRMENNYLAATGQITNMIFRRAAGSDVDVFTIGFHNSLETFAAPAKATDAEKETAAVDAGFKDRADISFYLRSLITSHHDTLAVKVP